MSSTTWTPRTVASEAKRRARRLWRAVEAQHVAPTTRLVDNLAEQALLEDILEQSKPAPPDEARGSRFRSAADPGVFYAARANSAPHVRSWATGAGALCATAPA